MKVLLCSVEFRSHHANQDEKANYHRALVSRLRFNLAMFAILLVVVPGFIFRFAFWPWLRAKAAYTLVYLLIQFMLLGQARILFPRERET